MNVQNFRHIEFYCTTLIKLADESPQNGFAKYQN